MRPSPPITRTVLLAVTVLATCLPSSALAATGPVNGAGGSSVTAYAPTTPDRVSDASARAAAPAAPAASRQASGNRYAKKALRATNVQRRNQGLRPLKSQRCLVRAARNQARAMADSQTIYHQELSPVLSRCGMRMVGENVAMGYPTGRAVVRGWMGSPGHRENILRREYRQVGIAAAQGSDGRWYAAQVFGRR